MIRIRKQEKHRKVERDESIRNVPAVVRAAGLQLEPSQKHSQTLSLQGTERRLVQYNLCRIQQRYRSFFCESLHQTKNNRAQCSTLEKEVTFSNSTHR